MWVYIHEYTRTRDWNSHHCIEFIAVMTRLISTEEAQCAFQMRRSSSMKTALRTAREVCRHLAAHDKLVNNGKANAWQNASVSIFLAARCVPFPECLDFSSWIIWWKVIDPGFTTSTRFELNIECTLSFMLSVSLTVSAGGYIHRSRFLKTLPFMMDCSKVNRFLYSSAFVATITNRFHHLSPETFMQLEPMLSTPVVVWVLPIYNF